VAGRLCDRRGRLDRRYHRAYVGEKKRRADEAERTREEEFRRRATEERLRIARELHDVLAHKISLINVQAGAALHRRDPEQAYAALGAIKDASKDTLRELRTTLGVLRQVDEEQPLGPAPSLERLGDLVDQTQEAGLPVKLTVSGERTALPSPVDLAAYRIVQEALTNAVRHAGSATATVLVRYDSERVVVEVCDDGCGIGAPEGNGIRGMRERAATLGGTLAAGPRPGGGFLVRASLPLRPALPV
jgi:signal transduction histidine kinase